MSIFALVTDSTSLPDDDDMPLLVAACKVCGIVVEVCAWDDLAVDWTRFDAVVLRSSWNYTERLQEFLAWCERVASITQLFNPLSVVRWSTDKHYLSDLAGLGVPVVPSSFIEPGNAPLQALREFLASNPQCKVFVVKPTVGSCSKDVQRYTRAQEAEAVGHIERLLGDDSSVILQPYLEAIDRDGETNLIYFDGIYSHAIRKGALLLQDGTVNAPTAEFRNARIAGQDERAVALAALNAVAKLLDLDRPLLYARVDLIRDDNGDPQLLELEICEPSLSLPFDQEGAMRFARSLAKALTPNKGSDFWVSNLAVGVDADV